MSLAVSEAEQLWTPGGELWIPSDADFAAAADDPAMLAELEAYLRWAIDQIDRTWVPSPKQRLAWELTSQVDELLYGGAAGGGKTEFLLEFLAHEMEAHPGNRGILFRRVSPSLEETVIPRARLKFARRAKWNGQRKTFSFPNGSVLRLGHMQYDGDVFDYSGAEYGVVAWEELTEFTEFQYTTMIARLRSPVPGVRPVFIATTNPGGEGHRWVKRRFIKPRTDDLPKGALPPAPYEIWTAAVTAENKVPRRRVFIPARAEDNPTLMARDPDYLNRLAEVMDPGLRKALRSGDWDAIDSVEGALWAQSTLDAGRVARIPGQIFRRAVAVDPSEGKQTGNAYGIALGSLGANGVCYVERVEGWRASPKQLGRKTIDLYREAGCDAIVVETNHGGAWLMEVLHGIDPYANIEEVKASEGKMTRAKPAAALFELDEDRDIPIRARLVGFHEQLEEYMTSYTGRPGEVSPDELDATVWLLKYLTDEANFLQAVDLPDARAEGRR